LAGANRMCGAVMFLPLRLMLSPSKDKGAKFA
jgi:hypothetical protein